MTSAVGTRERENLGARWGGGRSAWDVGWLKLMMWLFLISDAMTFAAMLIGLWVTRLAGRTWPNRLEIIDLHFVAAMTVILICSSTTMAMAVYAIRRAAPPGTACFLSATL